MNKWEVKEAGSRLIAILASIILVALPACGQAEVQLPTAIYRPTSITMPTADISPEDLAMIDLLIQEGDLPDGWTRGDKMDEAPGTFANIIGTQNVIAQGFDKPGGDTVGFVTVLFFDNVVSRDIGYDDIVDMFKLDAFELFRLDNLGEKATASKFLSQTFVGVELVFARCTADVYILIFSQRDLNVITRYAKRLDDRLQDVICLEG